MNPALTFSIVIDNYNYGRFLGAAIESALAQTWPEVEVIVVDDGSTDSSPEIIRSFGARIVPIFKQNGGQGSCFNSGFKRAHNAVILFLDSDDLLDPDACAHIAAEWTPETAKIHFPLRCVNEEGAPLGRNIPSRPLDAGEVWRKLVSVGYQTCSPTSGNAWSAAALRSVLPLPDGYRQGADEYLNSVVPFFGRVGALPTPLGSYRIHSRSYFSSTANDPGKFRQLLERRIVRKAKRTAVIRLAAARAGIDPDRSLEARDFSDLRNRLMSLRLSPKEHPVKSDRPATLLRSGVTALLRDPHQTVSGKLKHFVSFIGLAFCPAAMVQPLAAKFLRV